MFACRRKRAPKRFGEGCGAFGDYRAARDSAFAERAADDDAVA